MPITVLFVLVSVFGAFTTGLMASAMGTYHEGTILVATLTLFMGTFAALFAILEGQDLADRRRYHRAMVQRSLSQIGYYQPIKPASVYDRATQDFIDAFGDPWEALEELGLILAWAFRDATGHFVPVTDLTCRMGDHGCGGKVDVEVEEYRLDRVQSNSNYGFQAMHQVCYDEAEVVMEAEYLAWDAANPA